MMMFAKQLTGDLHVIQVEPTDTIHIVKEKIADKCGRNATDMRVICNGKSLEDGHTVTYYSMEEGSTIYCVYRLRAGMQIFIKTLTGKTAALQVATSSKILEIKQIGRAHV